MRHPPNGPPSLRSFQEGDEAVLAHLFTSYLAGFLGPSAVTPASWREAHRVRSWRGPSVEEDPDCTRLALVDDRVVGYAVTDYAPEFGEGTASLQELCVAPGPESEAAVLALMQDAEARARTRGKHALVLELSPADACVMRCARALGFEAESEGAGVFMLAVTDLGRFLREVEDELTRRLSQSALRDWRGVLVIASGEARAALRVSRGRLRTARATRAADLCVRVDPQALPGLLFGQVSAAEAFLQNQLAVTAGDRPLAVGLLDVLFPRVPLYFPRGQMW
jgi:hypothetical protein